MDVYAVIVRYYVSVFLDWGNSVASESCIVEKLNISIYCIIYILCNIMSILYIILTQACKLPNGHCWKPRHQCCHR